MAKAFSLTVDKRGVMRHLYSEDAAAFTRQLGEQQIRRASHVEPTAELSKQARDWLACWRRLGNNDCYKDQADLPDAWWADMHPSTGTGPVLGPFETRDEALAAEVVWLQLHHLPSCQTGQCSQH
jgi:hypothetical protein